MLRTEYGFGLENLYSYFTKYSTEKNNLFRNLFMAYHLNIFENKMWLNIFNRPK